LRLSSNQERKSASCSSSPARGRGFKVHGRSVEATGNNLLNRLLDGGERGFEGGISAAQYQAVAKVSKATATRHLSDLLEKGCITRLPGGGRSTRYQICYATSAPGS